MADEPVPPKAALLVTRNFPPLVGGMEAVNAHLLSELGAEWRVLLCGPQGCAASAGPAEAVAEAPLRPLPVFVLRTAWNAWRMARRHRPGLVLAGSGLSAPMAWLAARASGARLAVYLHGLDIIAPSRIYQWVWLPFIRACDLVLVNSANTGSLARQRGVAAGRIAVLNPGVDMPATAVESGAGFRARHGFEDAPLLLSVGRFTRRKGLAEFVERSLPALVRAHPRLLFAIIGDEAHDALHGGSGSERARIEAAARAAGVESRLRFLGRQRSDELLAAYQAADCHVFPVLALPGDVEGFGMVAIESAAQGLATAAFAVGGIPEAVQEGVSGSTVASGDYEALARAISALLQREPAQRAEMARRGREFARGFEWPAFGRKLRELVREAA